MSGMASFGCTKLCFSVICCLSRVLIWSPLFKGSAVWKANCSLLFLRDRGTLGVGGAYTLVDELFGYPFLNKAFTNCPFSSSAPNVDERVPALCHSVWTSAALWVQGWWQMKSRYLSGRSWGHSPAQPTHPVTYNCLFERFTTQHSRYVFGGWD